MKAPLHHTSASLRQIATAYFTAKQCVLLAGYAEEVAWQESLSVTEVTEQHFLRESAWVVLSSGMRESVVRKRFDLVSAAFLQWCSAHTIIEDAEGCRQRALAIFAHRGKVDAILNIARFTAEKDLDHIKQQLIDIGPVFLEQLPFIGPVTSRHLAKNLGLMVAKPDRHLTRLAAALDYPTVERLCADIAKVTEQPVPVVDLVLWRYATLHPDYITSFTKVRDPQIGANVATS